MGDMEMRSDAREPEQTVEISIAEYGSMIVAMHRIRQLRMYIEHERKLCAAKGHEATVLGFDDVLMIMGWIDGLVDQENE